MIKKLINEFVCELQKNSIDPHLISTVQAELAFKNIIENNFKEIHYMIEVDKNRPQEQIEAITKRAEMECFHYIANALKENKFYTKSVDNEFSPYPIIRTHFKFLVYKGKK